MIEGPVLGIFPSTLDTTGGIQSSGALALQALIERFGQRQTRILHYDSGGSKLKAAFEAVIRGGRPRRVLVWHTGLLKLLPFVDPSCSRGVVFLHGIECWRRLDRITIRILARLSLIVTNSEHTWARFVDANPVLAGRPHITVPLGIGERLQGASPMPVDPPAAVMVGRLDARENYKGHREVIQAWPSVCSRIAGAQLHIVGDGTLRPELERLVASLGVRDAVHFHGQVPQETRDRLLAEARCLALPSRAEGFGLVYAEAMRVGRPCLVSTEDAGREVVDPPDAGLAADLKRPSELQAALCRLLADGQEWQTWSERARQRYEERFTAALFRERLIRAFCD